MNRPTEAQPPSTGKELVVFQIIRDSQCAECQDELYKGSLLIMEKGKPLCMKCADLDHLAWLPSGDAALSRRAKKCSSLWAVVVKFSRARKRYERQGLLVEDQALERAEQECLADNEARESRRIRDAERRAEQDQQLAKAMESRLKELFPGCPPKETSAIAQHTSVRSSGRVGRSEAGRNLEEEALRRAVIAYIRHRYTKYDELLMSGMERALARQHIWEEIEAVLQLWSAKT